MEPIDSYCVLISSKVVYFLKPGDYVDREAIFLEVKYDDLYHCLVSKDHGKVYVQLTKKAESTSSGVAIPGPSHQKPMVRHSPDWFFIDSLESFTMTQITQNILCFSPVPYTGIFPCSFAVICLG